MKKFFTIFTVLAVFSMTTCVFAKAGVIYAPPLKDPNAGGVVQPMFSIGNDNVVISSVPVDNAIRLDVTEEKYGLGRLIPTMAKTGNIAQITNLQQVNNETWTCTIKSDKWWANGQWLLTHQATVPDMTKYKNAYWYSLYDEKMNRNGYILATKQ